MKKSYLLSVLLLILITLLSFAQKVPIKFGKIDIEDLKMSVYEKDTSEVANVLCDYGNLYFIYSDQYGFQYKFDRIIRIKIFKKGGYKYADFEIPLYHKGNNQEKITSLKAFTYNIENGKVVKDKLAKNAVYTEKTSKYRDKQKFTMPNVKEGSIIEIQYSIKSDYLFNLRKWKFQNTIPVKWSEYRVRIPEYYYYKQLFTGYEPLIINEKSTIPEKFTYSRSVEQLNTTVKSTNTVLSSFESNSNVYRWAAKDVPAFKKESHITSVKNYITYIGFELSTTKYPNSTMKFYSKTWESINTTLLESENFGIRLNRTKFIEDDVEKISSNYNSEFDKMIAVYDFVKTNLKWNDHNRVFADKSLKKTYDDRAGSSSEINLFLTMMLREVGLSANPIILSTRKNGIIHPLYPSTNKLNYVISYVKINDNEYLLDATEKNCPYYLIPQRCLNGKGRIISEKFTDWIDLTPKRSHKYIVNSDFKINDKFELTGKISTVKYDYAALEFRNNLEKETNIDKYVEKLMEKNQGLEIDSFNISQIDSINLPVKEEYNVVISDKIELAGDLIIFNPMLYDKLIENPFKLEEREYPIDFAYPREKTYILNFYIPDGYILEEKPQDLEISLPDNAAIFNFNIKKDGRLIQVTSMVNINKTMFVQYEYQDLKKFYTRIIEKHAEQIVLKKI
ncbi:MAG: DUF3857 domain-containing protein [Bacteroidales bacterium]|nr:DUF3857 domain-containing protein [Bacteroidales bacterium]